MAGSSKHYVLHSPTGKKYIDYQIFPILREQLVPYLSVEPNTPRAVVDNMAHRLAGLNVQKIGWRKKLQELLAMRTARFRRDYPVEEFTVYPKKSVERCEFRQMARSYRAFKLFKSRKDELLPDLEATALRPRAAQTFRLNIQQQAVDAGVPNTLRWAPATIGELNAPPPDRG